MVTIYGRCEVRWTGWPLEISRSTVTGEAVTFDGRHLILRRFVLFQETDIFRRNSIAKKDDDNLVMLSCLIRSHMMTVFLFHKIMEGNGADCTLFTAVELLKTWLVIQKPQGTRCFVVYVLESIQQITTYCSESFRFYGCLQECDHKTRTVSGTVCMLLKQTPDSWAVCCTVVVSNSSVKKTSTVFRETKICQ
jgi:hypothetical protein